MARFGVLRARNFGLTASSGAVAAALVASMLSAQPAAAVENPAPISAPEDYQIQGTLRVGETVHVSGDGWTPADVELDVTWSVDGTEVDDPANDDDPLTLALSAEWVGQIVQADISATAGEESATLTLTADEEVAPGIWTLPAPVIQGTAYVGQQVRVDISDVPAGASVAYQWAIEGADIDGATDDNYRPVESQVGLDLSVRAIAVLAGYEPATATSAPVTVATQPDFPSVGYPELPSEIVAGSATTVNPGDWPEGTALTYTFTIDGVPIDTVNEPTYEFAVDAIGHQAAVIVNATHANYAPVSTASDDRTVTGLLSITKPLTIAGATRVGSTLSGSFTVTPAPDLAYAWAVDGIVVSIEETFIPSNTYAGKSVTLSVIATKDHYRSETLVSAAVTVGVGVFASAPTPTITGTAKVGSTLKASVGTWAPTPTFTYQWLRNGALIKDATASSYSLVAADLNAAITVHVTGNAQSYTTKVVKSASVTVAAGTFTTAPTPKITGTAKVGSTLKVTAGTWAPSATLKYQWLRNGAAIKGATGASYKLVAADVKTKITVQVTGAKAGYTSKAPKSASVTVAVGTFSAPTPKLTGTVKVGSTLKASVGAWVPTPKFTYQWLRNGAAIKGATSSSYNLSAADLKTKISLQVTGTSAGYTTKKVTSASATVASGTFTSAPTPKVAGTVIVGSTLKASAGTWSPSATLKYQWMRNGVAVKGATASSYKLTVTDWNKKITVKVTATKTAYATSSRISAATAVVAKPFAKTTVPTVSGSARVGATLTSKFTAWSPAPTHTFQWKRDGAAIANATKRTYVLTASDYGKKITVTVTGKRSAYITASKTSAATAKVAAPAPVISTGGTYRVGTDIKPGTYFANADSGCYWERRSNAGSDFSGIIANEFMAADARTIVTISSSDKYFKVDSECGSWTKLIKLGSLASSFGDGAHAVGIHIQPGLYKSTKASDGCYWEVLSGFSGELKDIVANDFTYDSPNYVQITSADAGFTSGDCGTWTRVGK